MYGYRPYPGDEPDWLSQRGRLAPPPPWLYQRPPRYPVYRRHDPYPPGWYPPGHVQLYGRPYQPPPSPYYYDELFRSSSANLPVAPPPAEYALHGLGRSARRTKSSVQASRPRRTHVQPSAKPSDQFRLSTQQAFTRSIPQGLAAGFATRFFNDRHPATAERGGQRLSNQMLVEPGLHNTEFYPESRKVLVGQNSTIVEPSYRVGQSSSNESLDIAASHRYLDEADSRKDDTRATYRIVSELLPRSTQLIHEAILESGRPEVILEAGQLRKHSRDSSCTCYQCHEAGIRKHSSSSIFHDENYNIAVPSGNEMSHTILSEKVL
jgi:hypothetical protein